MSNHYHLVVRLSADSPEDWTTDEILKRWTTLFRGPTLIRRYRTGDALSSIELDTVSEVAAVYRARLCSLSWFMKCLNEPIARQANKEDDCSGHFWEARFHSQPLTSERAVLAAMAYVDLNPVRARIARTPETSEYTSLKARVSGNYRQQTLAGAVSRMLASGEINHFELPVRPLMPFDEEQQEQSNLPGEVRCLPMQEREYLALVDLTGHIAARGKRGRIDPGLEPVLKRLGMATEEWISASMRFRTAYRHGDLKTAL